MLGGLPTKSAIGAKIIATCLLAWTIEVNARSWSITTNQTNCYIQWRCLPVRTVLSNQIMFSLSDITAWLIQLYVVYAHITQMIPHNMLFNNPQMTESLTQWFRGNLFNWICSRLGINREYPTCAEPYQVMFTTMNHYDWSDLTII